MSNNTSAIPSLTFSVINHKCQPFRLPSEYSLDNRSRLEELSKPPIIKVTGEETQERYQANVPHNSNLYPAELLYLFYTTRNNIMWKLSTVRPLTILILLLLPFLVRAQQTVRINEFMASNSETLADTDGEYSDWLEIYNPTSNPVDLTGWSLTDDQGDTRSWVFPEMELGAQEYLLVFASGKDLTDPAGELHAGFRIDADGEYLALFNSDGQRVTEFTAFPEQQEDVSYCYYSGEYMFSTTPTPGGENTITGNLSVSPPVFNKPHGFYGSPFEVAITSDDETAQIYYTTDGSAPSVDQGKPYSGPITIQTTTVLRAVAVQGDFSSTITTSTYLFLNDVLTQSNDPEGYPAEWGSYVASEGTAIADYEMDPEVVNDPEYRGQMEEALLSIPTMSIVTNKGYLFSHSTDPDTGGIYIYTAAPGAPLGTDWERPASVEFFNSDDGLDFQEDCGIKIHGGHSRRPEKTPKHSFRLLFKDEYGDTKLNYPLFGEEAETSLNAVVLRATYGNTWLHRSASEREHALLLHDLWAKDTQLDMGHPAGHGRFVHLYINGLYWGVYNPTERVDNEFAEEYFGGSEEDYDVIKDYGEIADGQKDAWNALIDLADKDVSDDANYFRLLGKNPDGTDNPEYESYLDIVNFIDYMIIHFYGANWDWDHHNWIAARNRMNPGRGFKFFSWDSEHILENIQSNVLDENNSGRPSGIFQQLRQNPDFLRLFADRVQNHFYSDGAITPEAASKRLTERAEEIDLAIIAESARWGDYRRDVHRSYSGGPFDLYTKEHWLAELSFLTDEYFPNRGEVFIEQLREADLFPSVDAPAFFINGEPIHRAHLESGDTLSMSSLYGTIYYTLDGTDPAVGDDPSSRAIEYADPIVITRTTHVKARLFYREEWSALTERILPVSDDTKHLKLTEIHYHPLPDDSIDDGDFEFIELKNTGENPVGLDGMQFVDGISYTFPKHTAVNPGEFIVLASDASYFIQRYDCVPFGQFDGSIDNGGERITMIDTNGDTLIDIRYDDSDPWPETPDGEGYSLVSYATDPTRDQNDPGEWRASAEIHGSPGADDKISTGLSASGRHIPGEITLFQNYPNPFNPETSLMYRIPESGLVKLVVYDLRGKEAATLVDEMQSPGEYHLRFDASGLPSGIYFYRLTHGRTSRVKKMILLR